MPHATSLLHPLPGMPAAIYMRVSTDKQAEQGYSLPTQRDACTAYVQTYGFHVKDAHVFIDDETGTSLVRPGLQELRDVVHARLIQAVIVYRLDRLGRDLGSQLVLKKEFDDAGVHLFDTTSPPARPSPERTLLQQMQGAIAEYEHAQIRERTERGRRGRAKAGIPFPRTPFGYRYVGQGKDAHYEIDPEEAAIVLQIYHWAVHDGLGVQAMATRLNTLHLPTAHARRGIARSARQPLTSPVWQSSTVHRIVTNADYLGSLHYGKTMNLPSQTQPTKKTRHQQTDPATWTPIAIPALVPRALFDAAQDRLAFNAANSPRRRKREYLLIGGRLRCDICRHHMMGVTLDLAAGPERAYRCFHPYDGTRRRSCRMLHAAYVEARIWDEVCQLAQSPRLLAELLDRMGEETAPSHRGPDRQRLEQEYRQAERGLERLVDLYLTGDVPKDIYTKKKAALDQQRTLAHAQLLALEAQAEASADVAAQRAEVAEIFRAVGAVLASIETMAEQQKILDMLRLTVYYTTSGDFRLDVVVPRRPGSVSTLSDSNSPRCIGSRHNASPAITLTWTVAA